jgi:ABC-2 type transport system permease protein
MNIFKREFKLKLVSALIWSVSIFGIIILFMSVYSAFAQSTDMIDMIMQNYPKELLQAFGMSGVDIGSVAGYFTMCMLFVQLALAVQSSIYGFSILSEEERDMTADFLLTRPITRTRVFLTKTLAAFCALLITWAFTIGSTFMNVELFRAGKDYDSTILVKMTVFMILFQLFFFSVGMLVSVILKKIKSVLPYAMGLSFGMYMISTVGSIIGEDTLGYITPFKYFEPNYLIINGNYDTLMVVICCSVIAAAMVSSYILYIRRNVHSAS